MLVAAVLSATVVSPAFAISGLQTTDVAYGNVNAIAVSGNTAYIGGTFDYVGPRTGASAALDSTTGTRQTPWPEITGTVNATASDGSGGWYVGGSFSTIDGSARNNLVHITSSGTVDSTFASQPNGAVRAIVVSGSTVYIAGDFTAPRQRVAALIATTGATLSFNPGSTNGSVWALALSGSTLYAGGDFTTIGGQSRSRIAALDATSGSASSWNPAANNRVRALAVSGTTVYAAGDFTILGSATRNHAGSVDTSSNNATSGFDPEPDAVVEALAVSGSTVYLAGGFYTVAGQTRQGIAAVDPTSGALTSWDPEADCDVESLALSGSTLYAGGCFYDIGGQARRGVAALDTTSGSASSWDPSASSDVAALAVSGTTVLAGGSFVSVNGVTRRHLAAIDLTTGQHTSWNPGADANVEALALSGSTLYVGGGFGTLAGQSRAGIGAVDRGTGVATGFAPQGADCDITTLAVLGSTVYAGGCFSTIGGTGPATLAGLDATTGAATGFSANPNGNVNALLASGSTLYVGGDFTSIGGQTRNYIAALDPTTGSAISGFDPNAGPTGSSVSALALSGSTLYLAGSFNTISNTTRRGIAAVDATSGALSSWYPNPNSAVTFNALALSSVGSVLYAHSTTSSQLTFSAVSPTLASRSPPLYAFDTTTGLPTLFGVNGTINNGTTIGTLAASGSSLLLGGSLTGTRSTQGFAQIGDSIPFAAASSGSASFTEQGSAVAVDPTMRVTDPDSTNLTGATVQVTTNRLSDDVLAFTDQNGITGSYDGTTGTMTLSGTASVAAYQAALRTITFSNPSDSPGSTRTVTFNVTDGTNTSNTTQRNVGIVNVNDAPVLSGSGGSVSYTENGADVVIDNGLTMSDVDNGTFQSATVSITTNFAVSQDVLDFTDQNGISGSYNALTGVLTLSGSATLADYQTALRSVTYSNSSDNPSVATRTITFVVNDGTDPSNAVTRDVTVTAVNDGPTVTTTGTTLHFAQGGTATAVDSGLTMTDPDSANATGATVKITGNFQSGEDVLAFTDQNGITGSYTASTGLMTLSGTASVAQYQAALRSVTYQDTALIPNTSTRTVSFRATDGTDQGSIATRDVVVDLTPGPPVLTIAGSTLTWTEGDPATAIDGALGLTDPDSPNLTGATVTLTNPKTGDELGYTTTSGVTGNVSVAKDVVTLSGPVTQTAMRTALRAVTFRNTSTDPNQSDRQISFSVTDGTFTGTGSRQIAVVAVDNAPVVTTTGPALTYTAGDPAVAVDPGLTVSDVDSTSAGSAVVRITNAKPGDVLAYTASGVPGAVNAAGDTVTLAGARSLAAYQAAMRSISFANPSPSADTTQRTVSFTVSGGALDSAPATRSIVIAAGVVSTPAPPTITEAPSSLVASHVARFAFTGAPGGTFECSLDGTDFASCSSPLDLNNVSDGTHTERVRQVVTGQRSDPASATWTVDTTPPTTEPTVIGHPPDEDNSRSATFEFQLDPGATAECKIDDKPFQPCASPVTYNDLADGRHRFVVHVVDAAGNTGPDNVTEWAIDPSFTPGPTGTNVTKVVALVAGQVVAHGDEVSVGCELDKGSLQACDVDAYTGTASRATSVRTKIGHGHTAVAQRGSRNAVVHVKLNERGRRLVRSKRAARIAVEVKATPFDTGTVLTTTTTTMLTPRVRLFVPVTGLFADSSAALGPVAWTFLRSVADQITAAKRVRCLGYTARGRSDAVGHHLGLQRAREACAFLVAMGVTGKTSVRGPGARHPRASNRTIRGRSLNRRVEIRAWY